MNNPNPPERAERLAKWSLAPWERPAVMGDLQEEFRDLAETVGEPAARRWYWRQAIESVWPNFMRRLKTDDQRRNRWWGSIALIANGCVMLITTNLMLPPHGSLERRLIPVSWIVFGAIGAVQAVVRKRLKAPTSQARTIAVYVGVTWVVCVVGVFFLPAPPRYSLIMLFSGVVVLEIWPWWPPDPPPAEFRVRPKTDAERSAGGLLTITVPNAPLGMSGLVLAHACAPADAAVPSPILFYEPTLDRTFTPADAVRVYAAINLTGPSAQATVDVVDAIGRVARTVQTTADAGLLRQIAKEWDELVDDDPAEHFGQVDVTLPLADLAPGPYRLRVTAKDAAHTSRQEESIVVRAAPGRRGR